MLRFNPQGRLLFLAGFGNLPGDIEVFDIVKKEKIGHIKAPCTVTCEWSPNGKHLLTSTIAPRLRVDNGWKLFEYYGNAIKHQGYDCLLQAEWVPSAKGTYPDFTPEGGKRDAKGNLVRSRKALLFCCKVTWDADSLL